MIIGQFNDMCLMYGYEFDGVGSGNWGSVWFISGITLKDLKKIL